MDLIYGPHYGPFRTQKALKSTNLTSFVSFVKYMPGRDVYFDQFCQKCHILDRPKAYSVIKWHSGPTKSSIKIDKTDKTG